MAATALNGIVSLRLLTPDEPGHASAGAWTPELRAGILVNDVRYRLTYMDEAPQTYMNDAWECTRKPLVGDDASRSG